MANEKRTKEQIFRWNTSEKGRDAQKRYRKKVGNKARSGNPTAFANRRIRQKNSYRKFGLASATNRYQEYPTWVDDMILANEKTFREIAVLAGRTVSGISARSCRLNKKISQN